MIHKAFSVYDSKAEAFILPFYALTTGLAIRSFEEAANKEGHDFQKYAADYTLFEIGTYDTTTGLSENLTAHINLGTALQSSQVPANLELARSERS